jgi:hypothetical protein
MDASAKGRCESNVSGRRIKARIKGRTGCRGSAGCWVFAMKVMRVVFGAITIIPPIINPPQKDTPKTSTPLIQ